jgi:hypothetical protein
MSGPLAQIDVAACVDLAAAALLLNPAVIKDIAPDDRREPTEISFLKTRPCRQSERGISEV